MADPLSRELVDFVESGISMYIGSRDRDGRPACVRGVGIKVARDRRTLTVYLYRAVSDRVLSNLADNGEVALCLGRPIDHRTVQIKGKVLEMSEATAEELPLQEAYLAGFVEQLYCVGLPRAVTRRLRLSPAMAVRVEIHALFDQTPGPGAGRPLATETST